MKKFLLSLLASLVLLFSFAPYFAVSAQGTSTPPVTSSWYNQGFGDWFLKVNDQSNPSEIFGERYTAAQVQWVIYGLWSFMINFVVGPRIGAVVACVFSTPSQQQEFGTCLEPALAEMIGISYASPNKSLASLVFADRPLSGISYIRNKARDFSLVPPVQAQTLGFGFEALRFVQDMWTSFRNIAYGLFVIAAVVFAFMIMFRVKISPQTVISVQSAIPKIVVALILVTFSYAIAGFLIDLIYVVIGLISLVVAPLVPPSNILQPNSVNASDVFNMLTVGPVTTSNATGTAQTSAGGILGLLGLYLQPILILIIVGILLMVVVAVVGAPTVVLTVIGAIAAVLLVAVLVIVLWMSIKIIFALFKAFANVILLTVFSPVYLVLGALIPNFGFGQWVKSYLSHLSVFVVTGVLAIFAWIFSRIAWSFLATPGATGPILTATSSGTDTNPWPPLLGTFAGGGDFGLAVLFAGVAFVFFTMVPKATDLVQSFISGRPFAYGTALGEAMAPITSAYGQFVSPFVRTTQEYVSRGAMEDRARKIGQKISGAFGEKKSGGQPIT
ncbi:MAG TPA: hypothetical protein VJ227_03905 [Patescibacteria group bacterium]|nr:hypothetical protein [Patescibacteria group bacterium]